MAEVGFIIMCQSGAARRSSRVVGSLMGGH